MLYILLLLLLYVYYIYYYYYMYTIYITITIYELQSAINPISQQYLNSSQQTISRPNSKET